MKYRMIGILPVKLIKESGLNPLEWIEKYAEDFRDIMRKEIFHEEKIKEILYKI